MPVAVIALIDAVVVLAFATTGRASHKEGISVPGILDTAWPFLVGVAIGWLIVYAVRRRTPLQWSDGMVLAVSALVCGMLLRQLTGAGTAVPFIIVAAIVLITLLVGWRALAAALRRRRSTP